MHDMSHASISAPAPDTTDETFAARVRRWVIAAGGKNGFHLLKTGAEALAARLAVIRSCRDTLDLQYYMLQDDLTGKLIIEELFRAADRGVKIRALLDDLDFGRAKEAVCSLNAHENIEFRIFNPASTRRQRWLFRVSKWSKTLERYTKRMHNKAIVADRCFGIVGGRNLGDEYFDASEDFAFSDLDTLLVGPVLEPLDACFERFWNSAPAHDLSGLGYEKPSHRSYTVHRIALRKYYDDVFNMKAIDPVQAEDYLQAIGDDTLPLIWAEAEFVSDEPEKVLTPVEEATSPPMRRLEELLDDARTEFTAVTPYFIPGKKGMGALGKLLERGVHFRLLTNSLASTDISAVHAAYSRYRSPLLRAGAEIHELKPIPGKRTRSNIFRRRSASRSSLHAKAYVIDREYVMIGSMNLDPRSWLRNTETMVILRSEEMAAEILAMFDDITVPATSYHVRWRKKGGTEWVTEKGGREIRYRRDPNPGPLRRLWAWIFYHTVPESQL